MMRALPALPHYQVLAPLAEGGMGQVFLARKEDSDVLSVIKTITEGKADDESTRRRFLREIAVTSRLDHPNIAKHLDSGEQGDLVYLVLEYLTGKDLWSIFKTLWHSQRAMPPEFALTLGVKVLDALAYAHALTDDDGHPVGLVHRDLSPKNVMVTFQGDAKIIDFGLARLDDDSMRTKTGTVLGTLRYLSPEQAMGQKADRRADIYTWAVVLYEALTSERLVKDTSREALTKAILVDDPEPISSKNRELPRALDEVFEMALKKDPEKRYPDAKSFAMALETAAPALVHVPNERIGEWMKNLFVADYRQSLALLRLAETVAPGSAKQLVAPGAPGYGLDAAGRRDLAQGRMPESGEPPSQAPDPPRTKANTTLYAALAALLVLLSALGGVVTYFVRHGGGAAHRKPAASAPALSGHADAVHHLVEEEVSNPEITPDTVAPAAPPPDASDRRSVVAPAEVRMKKSDERRTRRRPRRRVEKGAEFFSPGGTLELPDSRLIEDE